ncbi:MAG: quinolinate synthase NadA [bacterium]
MKTKELSAEQLFEKLKHITLGSKTCLYTLEKCAKLSPLINKINQLKSEKNALILAHSYLSPEIIYGVADFSGDSFELSKKAKETDADIIIFAAVKFMAETAKLLNPNKHVFIPSQHNGCSLADSINAEQVKHLKNQFPDHTFVCYINTTAEVKAYCDVCVTSSNALPIIKAIPNKNIYFLPDKLMAQNIILQCENQNIDKNIRYWDGTCYVHQEYDPELSKYIKLKYPESKLVAHPECEPNVAQQADFVGSTSQMINYVKQSNANQYFLLTECGLSSRLQLEVPNKEFIGSCTLCQYMKANTLENILATLESPTSAQRILLPKAIQKKALSCINAMFKYS